MGMQACMYASILELNIAPNQSEGTHVKMFIYSHFFSSLVHSLLFEKTRVHTCSCVKGLATNSSHLAYICKSYILEDYIFEHFGYLL